LITQHAEREHLTQNKQGRSRLSYANERPEFVNDNPLIRKVEPLTQSFENKRCPLHAKQLASEESEEDKRSRRMSRDAFKAKRRGQGKGSAMVKNHKPFPELKPSHALAHHVKAQNYYQELAKERNSTQRIRPIQTTTISKGDLKMEHNQNQNYQQNPQQQPNTQPQQSQNGNGVGNKPEAVLRDGSLKATIWRNVNNEGQTYFSTTLAKTYTDSQGNIKDTQNFSHSDLLCVVQLGREAYANILELKRGQTLEQSQSQQQSKTQDREAFKQSRRQSNGQNMPEPSQGF